MTDTEQFQLSLTCPICRKKLAKMLANNMSKLVIEANNLCNATGNVAHTTIARLRPAAAA